MHQVAMHHCAVCRLSKSGLTYSRLALLQHKDTPDNNLKTSFDFTPANYEKVSFHFLLGTFVGKITSSSSLVCLSVSRIIAVDLAGAVNHRCNHHPPSAGLQF